MLEAIAQIERYATRGQDTFNQDELLQVWIIHHLQIVGEAASKLSESFLTQHLEAPWPAIVEFRNILVHEYFRVNLQIVWQIVEQDLPNLKAIITDILHNDSS
ncbi:DUF86 domain-containing protein [Candidatus Synechococcus calcipolaris G9]|uniref:DUF86 domain-containing protein n=1 Tax=Candidatus Synechococcus calcipolaris G9 TaxID=1497997 RepID=A0ABT6F0Z4_9SYNE|nr:HepT-like ribonuclease domain-containing protein [Candidatus Synechococcus calcipolaris]MDG2991478.1 DUF86 domain-containing protein [Candidatus Synechococcus calcipolaris G9]